MLNFDEPDANANRNKFDDIGLKIWQLHLELVKLKSQIDDQIVILDENHMHLGFDNKVAGIIGTGLNNKSPESQPITTAKNREKISENIIHLEQGMNSEKLKSRI